MIDADRLLGTFLDLVRIDSPSGREERVAEDLAMRLGGLGLSPERDEAGNLFATVAGEGEPLLLTAHMDTVSPGENVRPVVRDGVVYSDGTTVLGADDKSGVAIILEVLEALGAAGAAHRPLDILFTVREETGLQGAKAFDRGRLRARLGVGLDAHGEQGTIVVQAPAQNALRVAVHGRMAHAGVNPQDGINAIRVAAEAIAAMPLGRIDAETTANIGLISGGTATNIVPDLVTLRGEARSRREESLEAQTRRMVAALEERAAAHGARAEVDVRRAYSAYTLTEGDEVVRLVGDAMRSVGVEPLLLPSGGGSDANVLNAEGVQTVQISTGMEAVHTCDEHIAVADMVQAAEIVWACTRA
jgi:tripeptide aminopeptidase